MLRNGRALGSVTPDAQVSPVFGRRRRRGLRFQYLLPVELDIGVVLLNPPDRFLVEGWPPHSDAGWRAEPVKNALLRPPLAAAGVDERGCFVSAFVPGEPQKW